MAEVYVGGSHSKKHMTKRAWKRFIKKLQKAYKQANTLKQKGDKQHTQDKEQAEDLLENYLNS